MAIGNPLLATWDAEGDVRIYEFSAGVFTLIGLRSGLTHNPGTTGLDAGASPVPLLQWFAADGALLTARTIDLEVLGVSQTDRFGDAIGTELGIDQGTIANTAPFIAAEIGPHEGKVLARAVIGSGSLRAWYILGDEAGSATHTSATSIPTEVSPSFIAAPDDGQLLIMGVAANCTMRVRQNGQTWPPTWAASTVVNFDIVPNIMVFDKAIRSSAAYAALIARDDSNSVLSVRYESGVWSTIMDLAMPAGDVRQIAMSPDQRLAAVSVLNGGTYTTRIFRRLGSYYNVKQDISGIGAHLSFSADGMLLVDVAARKVYERQLDETFDELAGAASALVTDQQVGAFSEGVIAKTAVCYIYDTALSHLAADDFDAGNLMFTLLDDTAVLDLADTDLAAILADETTTGLWPAGGVVMTGVVPTSGGGVYEFVCEDIQRIIIGSTGLSARYGLIYDGTADRPLIWVDFRDEVAVPTGRQLSVSFPGGVFLRFEK